MDLLHSDPINASGSWALRGLGVPQSLLYIHKADLNLFQPCHLRCWDLGVVAGNPEGAMGKGVAAGQGNRKLVCVDGNGDVFPFGQVIRVFLLV